jgi:hypothetical protein
MANTSTGTPSGAIRVKSSGFVGRLMGQLKPVEGDWGVLPTDCVKARVVTMRARLHASKFRKNRKEERRPAPGIMGGGQRVADKPRYQKRVQSAQSSYPKRPRCGTTFDGNEAVDGAEKRDK